MTQFKVITQTLETRLGCLPLSFLLVYVIKQISWEVAKEKEKLQITCIENTKKTRIFKIQQNYL